jgi:hypothetical protein
MLGRIRKGHSTVREHPDLVEARIEVVRSTQPASQASEDALFLYYQSSKAGGANKDGPLLYNKTRNILSDRPEKRDAVLEKFEALNEDHKGGRLEDKDLNEDEIEDQARNTTSLSLFTPSSSQNTSDTVASPTGILPKLLSGSTNAGIAKSAPGGIDFSTLELNYIAEDSGLFADRGLKYAFNGVPAAGNKNHKAGRIAAAQASDAFFVWLSLSPDKFWVNLNPNEPDRIIDPQLAKTDAGRILLQSDFQMKKTMAKLIHPDTSLGKQYWQAVMEQFWQQQKRNGSLTCPPVFRMWIVPSPATVREDNNGLYIADAPLNVKLESADFNYNSNFEPQNLPGAYSGLLASCIPPDKSIKTLYESLYRKFILPHMVKAVNTAPEYAELRGVYRSRVAAEWYRQRSASKETTYRSMVNNGDVSSWPARQNWSPNQVFNQYVSSLKNSEFRVTRTKQEGNMLYTEIYVFGGVDFTNILFNKLSSGNFQRKWGDLQQVVDKSMKSPVTDHQGKIWLGGSSTTPNVAIWFYLGFGVLVVPAIIYGMYAYRKRLQFSSSSLTFSAIGGKLVDMTIAFVIVTSCGLLILRFALSFSETYEMERQPDPVLQNFEKLKPSITSPQLITPEVRVYRRVPESSPSSR